LVAVIFQEVNTVEPILEHIVKTPELHKRWLCTLSYLELCGARKIAAYIPSHFHKGECSQEEECETLQHAAEEFRHAYFFHKQMDRVEGADSSQAQRFLGRYTARYLQLLDLRVSRLLKNHEYESIRKGSYLLTTYAIEKRAQRIYTLYQKLLKTHNIPISLKSILAEENGHLLQIESHIEKDEVLNLLKDEACTFESDLFDRFLEEVETLTRKFSKTY
jgi:hypothetical protein